MMEDGEMMVTEMESVDVEDSEDEVDGEDQGEEEWGDQVLGSDAVLVLPVEVSDHLVHCLTFIWRFIF